LASSPPVGYRNRSPFAKYGSGGSLARPPPLALQSIFKQTAGLTFNTAQMRQPFHWVNGSLDRISDPVSVR
jgi:hypothetical protein